MKTNTNVLNYIVKDINLSVARLGINTQLSVVTDEDYAGREYLKVESTPFQTMPVLFRAINIEGSVYVHQSKTDEEIIEVIVALDYRYTFFNGGSNGHTLGNFKYEVDKRCWDTWNGENNRFIDNRIYKVHGLSI